MRADRAVAGVANAEASIAVAEANARNAQVAVDYTLIRAPFDGVIVSKSGERRRHGDAVLVGGRLQGRRGQRWST